MPGAWRTGEDTVIPPYRVASSDYDYVRISSTYSASSSKQNTASKVSQGNDGGPGRSQGAGRDEDKGPGAISGTEMTIFVDSKIEIVVPIPFIFRSTSSLNLV